MTISGELLINGEWVNGRSGSYRAVNPATGETMEPVLGKASDQQVRDAVDAAQACAPGFRLMPLAGRAKFLRACAEQIMALGDGLIQRSMAETGLPRARLEGERARTCFQLNMFADVVENGDFLDARIDTAQPDRKPLPRPDIRYMNQAIGPVAVFGASNFPLAFSVAGGDTASAFAAGCPVLVKGHSSHPGTSELMARAIDKAVKKTGMPPGIFSLLMGEGSKVGSTLVKAPAVKAVGFTGSFAGGMAIVRLANSRPDPIPVFTEMGSQNPVILLPEKLEAEAGLVAQGFVTSLNMGAGQFCTNPGLVLGMESPGLDRFIQAACAHLAGQPAGIMLNRNIQKAYKHGVSMISSQAGVSIEGFGQSCESMPGCVCRPVLMTVCARDFMTNPKLTEEMFGPASLIVKCKDLSEMEAVIAGLEGQLTGTIQGTAREITDYEELIDLLKVRVGRIIVNGFPTGVEVCHAMVHGGPFPATSDVRFTSVGAAAIHRFLRPICLQDFPGQLLPQALQNQNPLNIRRMVNGIRTKACVKIECV